MNKNLLIKKLIKEGFSNETLSKMSDKSLNLLGKRILGEQNVTNDKNTVLISKKNPNFAQEVANAKKLNKTIETYESEEKWIQKAINPKKKGQLHKDLNVPQDETIPVSKLKKAAKEKGKVGKRARMALNLRKLNEWVENLVEEEYHSVTRKSEILDLIKENLKRK